MVASKRARQIATGGHEPMLPEENDKPTVIALREIAEGHVNASILDEQEELQQQFDEVQMDPELLAETTLTATEATEETPQASPDVDME